MNDWTERAACKGQPQFIFFPEAGPKAGDLARLICDKCEVRSECLDFAIRTRQEFGVWGGMNARERQRFEDNRSRQFHRASTTMRGRPVAADRPLADRQIVTADGR